MLVCVCVAPPHTQYVYYICAMLYGLYVRVSIRDVYTKQLACTITSYSLAAEQQQRRRTR